MYGYLESGKKYIPQVLSSECGKVKMQNHRKIYTNIPTIFHNFEDEKTEFGVYFMIFRSQSIIVPYPGPSAQFRKSLENVELNVVLMKNIIVLLQRRIMVGIKNIILKIKLNIYHRNVKEQ